MIQTVVAIAGPPQVTQARNVGDGEFYGVEFGIQARLAAAWAVAANYTHMQREIKDALQPMYQVVGAPDDSAFIAFTYEPSSKLTITPSVEVAGERWSDVTGGGYVRIGDYTLLNLQAQYRGSDLWELAAGASNLLDENFELAQGYPETGRNVYVRLRLTF
jgi:iron complex outermembrane receptor protein